MQVNASTWHLVSVNRRGSESTQGERERERERAGEREERRGGCGVELEMLYPSHHLPASHIPPRVLSPSPSVLIVSRKERRTKVTCVW